MPARKSLLTRAPRRELLEKLVSTSVATGVPDEQLQEQRVSFAYGNAPEGSRITKDSARRASQSIKLKDVL